MKEALIIRFESIVVQSGGLGLTSRWIAIVIILVLFLSNPLQSTSIISTSRYHAGIESQDNYQEMQLLPDTTLTGQYQFEENDTHNAFQETQLSSGVELKWIHRVGTELNFRYPKDHTSNLPDCEEFAIVKEAFNWEYNIIPIKLDVYADIGISLDGDFDAVQFVPLYHIGIWLIDSTGQWTSIMDTVISVTDGGSVHMVPSFRRVYRTWNGLIENRAGIQKNPNDTIQFAIGISPAYEFVENENNFWAWMSGAVRMTVTSIKMNCLIDTNVDAKDMLVPTYIGTSGTKHDDITRDIEFLEDGSIYLVGTSFAEKSELLLTKWDSTAELQWIRTLGGSNSWIGYGVAATSTNVFVTGSIQRDNETDTIIAKWDHQGGLQWNTSIDLGGSDYGLDLAVGTDGNVYVIGNYQGDFSTLSYLAAFDQQGSLLWKKCCGYRYSDYALEIGVSNDNSIYTATYLNMSKWNSDGKIEWSNGDVFASVRVTRDGDLYSTRFFSPSNLLQQWNSDGSKGWNITMSYNHPYFSNSLLTPILLGVTPVGWAYVLAFSRDGLPDALLSIYDTEGVMLWNQTIDPQYFADPYYFFSTGVYSVHRSGFVCVAPSVLNSNGKLDLCVQIYLVEKKALVISNPLTLVVIGAAATIFMMIPIDYVRRKRRFQKQEDFHSLATQIYLVS